MSHTGYIDIMTNHLTISPAETASFTPIALRAREDGLTPARQIAFIMALAECGSVTQACHVAGVSREAAYVLRRAARGADFAAAWDGALGVAVQTLKDLAMERAVCGETVTRYYKGEVIGQDVKHDNRLLMFLLQKHDAATYARRSDCESGQPNPLGRARRAYDKALAGMEQALEKPDFGAA